MSCERRNQVGKAPRAIAALVCLGALAGCVDMNRYNYFAHSGVDPASPVAAEVNAALATSGPYPKFSQIPPAPTDVRTAAQWRSTVEDVLSQQKTVLAESTAYPFTLKDTDAWAAQQQAKIPPGEQAASAKDVSKATEDYAKKQRERATPPSAPQ